MPSIPNRPDTRKPHPAAPAALAELQRIAATLERIEGQLDEFFRTFLNARFKYGTPVDRWGRGGRGAA